MLLCYSLIWSSDRFKVAVIFSICCHNDSRAAADRAVEWYARAQFPMQDDPSNTYRSGPSRKLLENAENADIEFSMAVLASAVQACVSVRAYLNQRPHTHKFCFLRTCGSWTASVLVRINTVFSVVVCASVWHTRTYIHTSAAATGWLVTVVATRRVGHRLPWQPEGRPFHPPGGISRGSTSLAARKLSVASSL